MFREMQQILHTAGMPLGEEELLDALWLVSRLHQGPDTLLAAQLAAAQQSSGRPAKRAIAAPGAFAPGLSDHLASPRHEHNPGIQPRPSSLEEIGDTAGLTPLTSAWHTGSSTELGLRVPGLKALAGDLAFGRALRPLKRSVPSTCATELDEEATAAAQADTRVPQVVLRPQSERWFRLVFIIDSAASMLTSR